MYEFKIGDKVRRSDCNNDGFNRGDIGIIERVKERISGNVYYDVRLTDGRISERNHKIYLKLVELSSDFKVGDRVRCIETNGKKGAGWNLGDEFIIQKITDTSSGIVYWRSDNKGGCYYDSIELIDVQEYKTDKTKTNEVNKMELKDMKKENLVEAKKQIVEEKKNAEIENAKSKLRNATDEIDRIDREIYRLEREKEPYEEVLKKFK